MNFFVSSLTPLSKQIEIIGYDLVSSMIDYLQFPCISSKCSCDLRTGVGDTNREVINNITTIMRF